MRSFLISDNHDTWVGMRLAGIEGVIVHEKEALLKQLQKVREDHTIGLLILTEKVVALAPEEVGALKIKTAIPLVIEIPDRHGTHYEQPPIAKYIKESVGVSL